MSPRRQYGSVAWRVGYDADPLGFVPRAHCSWQGRFDDPLRQFRTLYLAFEDLTALREKLGPLRPSTAAYEMEKLFGTPPQRKVGQAFLDGHRLAAAEVWCDSAPLELEDLAVRRRITSDHATLLRSHGVSRLDIGQLRSRERALTQALARALYDDGESALIFRSTIDNEQCVALFEGRGEARSFGNVELYLNPSLVPLVDVCREFDLELP